MEDALELVRRWFEQSQGLPRRDWPDRRGEYQALCPYHSDRRRGNFSFSERGYKCFACGAKGSTVGLARDLGLIGGGTPPPPPRPRPPRRPEPEQLPAWRRDPDYLRRFDPVLPRAAVDYLYDRGVTWTAIRRARLCYGVLPLSRATTPRLIVPYFLGPQLVGLRGRSLDGSEPKWAQSYGSAQIPYGQDGLRAGAPVVVVESPVSALAVGDLQPGYVVLGAGGTNTWREEWTALLARYGPPTVEVWFDHDGDGMKAGAALANALRAGGLPAWLVRWSAGRPDKWDPGDEASLMRRRGVVGPRAVWL